jgi:hypothetical protein
MASVGGGVQSRTFGQGDHPLAIDAAQQRRALTQPIELIDPLPIDVTEHRHPLAAK